MIDDLKPIVGMPTFDNRVAWLNYARKLKCAFLVIIRLPETLGQSVPLVVWERFELFTQLDTIQRRNTYFSLEIYNPNLDHSRQIEMPLIVNAIACPNLAPKRYDVGLFNRYLPNLAEHIDELSQTSQFDLELWFQIGLINGAEYMILAINPLIFPQYYPIYSNKEGLLDKIIDSKPAYLSGAVALFRLDDSFKYQYMNGAYSTLDMPKRFYNVREETLPVLMNDPEIEGFRRRLMDFFCLSQLYGPDTESCIGSALELLEYGKKLNKNKRSVAVALLMKTYDSVQHEGMGHWRLLPYSLLLTYYKKPIDSKQGIESCLFTHHHHVRKFSMTCYSLFIVDFKAIVSAIQNSYQYGFELRGLLHLLWHSKANKEQKIEFIREQLKVDKTAVKWGLKLPTSDMIKELYLYLKPHTMPNPFAENFNILLEYKDRCYHEDNNLYYALHTDPNPRLQFVRERTICVRKAEKGDLQSILNLAAYYYWCEGEYGDYPKAIKWIKKGVKQNHPTALCLLGCAYWSGNGVDQNIGKAIDLLTQSAQMGYATAYYHLSKCYEYTQPPVCDYIKAYAYLLISKWAVTDYPEYNDVDERMSYVYRSKLNKNESLYDEAIELARRIYPTLVFVDNEPALYMGEACQKELTENWIRWKWNSISDGVSDLPINQL